MSSEGAKPMKKASLLPFPWRSENCIFRYNSLVGIGSYINSKAIGVLRLRKTTSAIVLAGMCLLLSGCAHLTYDHTELPPGSRIGAWTFFRLGEFPTSFQESIHAEAAHFEDWAEIFQADLDRKWPFETRPEHLPQEGLQFYPGSNKGDFQASAVAQGLDAYLIFSLCYYMEHSSTGYVLNLALTAQMVRTADEEKLWFVTVSESGRPIDLLSVQQGTLSRQYPRLVETCVKRILKMTC